MLRFGKTERDFQDVYQAHAGGIHRTLKAMTGNHSIAEELTQEAFVKAWKALPQFGFRSSLKTWIYQVAINLGRDWLRGHKTLSLDHEHEAEYEEHSERQAIHESILELEEDSRNVVILYYGEGMKQDEMAKILSISEGTVKSRLFSAKSKLKHLLLQKGYDV